MAHQLPNIPNFAWGTYRELSAGIDPRPPEASESYASVRGRAVFQYCSNAAACTSA